LFWFVFVFFFCFLLVLVCCVFFLVLFVPDKVRRSFVFLFLSGVFSFLTASFLSALVTLPLSRGFVRFHSIVTWRFVPISTILLFFFFPVVESSHPSSIVSPTGEGLARSFRSIRWIFWKLLHNAPRRQCFVRTDLDFSLTLRLFDFSFHGFKVP